MAIRLAFISGAAVADVHTILVATPAAKLDYCSLANSEKDMARKMIVTLAAAMGLTIAACNTVEGVGRDVESVGKTVQDAAN